MTAVPRQNYISPEDYLAMERDSPEKHEYFDGEIFQMAGASFAHNLAAMNISGHLFGKLNKDRCRVVQSDMRLFVQESGLYTYPDVMVVCGKPELQQKSGLDNLINPVLIIEVLSPSTENYDKGTKFEHYRTVESLEEYLMVWQNKKRVARYTKRDDASWVLTDFIGDDVEIELNSIECSLSMEEIYENVDFAE